MADKAVKRHAMLASMGPATPGTAFPAGLTTAEAGVPSGKNAGLWALQAITKMGMPQFQELMRFLPMAPTPMQGMRAISPAFEQVVSQIPKVMK